MAVMMKRMISIMLMPMPMPMPMLLRTSSDDVDEVVMNDHGDSKA